MTTVIHLLTQLWGILVSARRMGQEHLDERALSRLVEQAIIVLGQTLNLVTYTRRVQVLMRFVHEAKKASDILEANWEILEMVEEPYMSKSRDTSSCVQLDSSLWGAHSRVAAMATHEAPGSIGSAGPHQWLTCHLLQSLQPHLSECSLRRSPFEGGHPMELVVVSVVASELAMHPGMYHSPEGSKMCHVQTHCYNL